MSMYDGATWTLASEMKFAEAIGAPLSANTNLIQSEPLDTLDFGSQLNV